MAASSTNVSGSPEAPALAAEDAARDFEFRARRSVVIAKALHGDASLFGQYVAFSAKCRGLPVEIAETESDCSPASVAASDSRFVSIAERLAASGAPDAQLALGQYWLSVAARSLASQAVAGGDPAASPDAQSSQPIEPEDGVAVRPPSNSPEFLVPAQKAANLFAQAAATSGEPPPQLAFLQSIGINAIGEKK